MGIYSPTFGLGLLGVCALLGCVEIRHANIEVIGMLVTSLLSDDCCGKQSGAAAPNQALEPIRLARTPSACAEVAPAKRMAHL